MKKRIGVKRSLQHPQSSSSCVTSQEQFHKYNPDIFDYHANAIEHERLHLKKLKSTVMGRKYLKASRNLINSHVLLLNNEIQELRRKK